MCTFAEDSLLALRTIVRGRVGVALLLLLPLWSAAAAFVPSAHAAESEWHLKDRVDGPETGYVLYERRPADSDYDAYRLEAIIAAAPAVVAAAARADMADPTMAPANTEKKVLRDEGDEVVVYTYADLPMVADRDVTTHAHQSFDAATGTYRLAWQATSDEGPAPRPGVVRLEKSSGSWTFSPLPDGRTRVVYENHSDLAGSIPAWIINPLMTGAVVDGLTKLRARVARDTNDDAQKSAHVNSRAAAASSQ